MKPAATDGDVSTVILPFVSSGTLPGSPHREAGIDRQDGDGRSDPGGPHVGPHRAARAAARRPPASRCRCPDRHKGDPVRPGPLSPLSRLPKSPSKTLRDSARAALAAPVSRNSSTKRRQAGVLRYSVATPSAARHPTCHRAPDLRRSRAFGQASADGDPSMRCCARGRLAVPRPFACSLRSARTRRMAVDFRRSVAVVVH